MKSCWAGLNTSVVAAFMLVGSCVSSPATTYLVTDDDGGDFQNIQSAIDAVNEGDTLLIARGTYYGDGNWELDLAGKNLVFVSQEGLESVVLRGRYDDWHRVVHLHSGEDDRTVFDGIMFHIGGHENYDDVGGLVYLDGASPVFRNCIFSAGFASDGGALYCVDSNVQLIDCWFRNGVTGRGSSVYADGGAPSLINCFVDKGHAGDSGGAFYFSSAAFEMTGCFVRRSSSVGHGGALVAMDCVGARIEGCTFQSSEAHTGADLCLLGASEVDVTACSFVEGRAEAEGASVYCGELSNVGFERCIFAFTHDVEPFECDGTVSFRNCISYGNAAGDSLCGSYSDNLFVDPRFCDSWGSDYGLCANSPALPANNPWNELIGAWGENCGDCYTPVTPVSWGSIKALFR